MRLTSSTRSSPLAREPGHVWAVVAAAGPGPHWYVDALPLRLRALLDRLAGGAAPTPPPERDLLEAGDRAGFWRVTRADGRVLELEAAVRAPGTVRLSTSIAPDERGYDLATRLTQQVSFAPAGLLGAAYLLLDLPAREVLIELVHRRTLADAG